MEPPALYRYQPSVSAPTLSVGPAQPANSRPVVTGYLRCHGKATDNYQGAQLQQVFQTLGVKMEELPPFEAVTAIAGHPGHGVVKINNIPFTVTAQEIAQFISRFTNAPMIKKHLHGFPIHVIMEKPTGKTMDCFVEFRTQDAARDCVKRFEYSAQPGRGTKIGNRNVSLDLSSQAELMRAVFPRSRLAEFDQVTGRPRIMSHDEDPSWTAGFRGYITLEEIYGMTRFAETPSRSPFVLKCNQRVYESMVTTLYKFPWAATQTYTLAARDALFAAIRKQLQVLSKKVNGAKFNSADVVAYDYNQGYYGERHHTNNGQSTSPYNNGPASVEREVGLSQELLSDLLFAGVNCPGFSLLQKYELCQAAGSTGRGVPLSHIAANWTFSTLAPAKDVPDQVIDFWIQIFDLGFDLITDAETETTYEHYINFVRNPMGFPVAEWTPAGLELPFEDAIRIEMEVVMIYMSRGREVWAYEQGLPVSKWHVGGLMDLMKKIAIEKEAGRYFEPGEPKIHDHLDRGVSPTTTEFTQHSFPVTDNIRDATATGLSATTSVASGNNSQAQIQTPIPNFNPATAKEFIPTSSRQVSLFDPEPNNIYCAFKSIWSDPPVGPSQPSQASISNVNLNAANTANNTQGNKDTNQDPRSESRIITAFRDPFGPPSHEARGFNRRKSRESEDPRLDYCAPPSADPQSFFNPFQNRGTTLNANQISRAQRTESLSVSDAMRQLSLSTAAASRNNSTDTTLVSTTTDATSYRNSSFTAAEEHGSLTSKRTQVQEYPDITYSNARLTPGNTQTTPNQFGGRRNALVEFNGGAYADQGQAQGPTSSQALTPFSPTATEKLRTQSTPFAGCQYNVSNYQIPALPGLEKRGSLPVNVAAPGTSDSNDTQTTRGGTAAGYYGHDGANVNANINAHAGTGGGNGGGNGRLGAAELWKQVRAYW